MLLGGPTGRNAIPMSDMAGCSPITEGISLTLDDEDTVSWPVPLTSGTFQPFDNDAPGSDPFPAPAGGGAAPPQDGGMSLSTFDGTNPNGVWRLYVIDDDSTSLGRLAGGWSLTIKAKVRR